ncbi:MAG: hypothetical protein IJ026_01945 [Candidatus Methanomethylophilaceae archaeon]|nr:hypothetical protein [Candidatus Methanomethylophilaceae archaeon]
MRCFRKRSYTEIATYLFLARYESSAGRRATWDVYNRFMLSLDRHLLSIGTDMQLPRCWYVNGEEVVVHGMEDYLGRDIRYRDPDNLVYRGGTPFGFEPSDPVVGEMESYISHYLSMATGDQPVVPGSSPPYRFQECFQSLMDLLESYGTGSVDADEVSVRLGAAVSSLPRGCWGLEEETEEFLAVFRMGLEVGSTPRMLLRTVHCFWSLLCEYLRVDERCRSNVPKVALATWEEDLPYRRSVYAHGIRTHAYHMHVDTYDDPFIERMLREKREADDSALALLAEINRTISGDDGPIA